MRFLGSVAVRGIGVGMALAVMTASVAACGAASTPAASPAAATQAPAAPASPASPTADVTTAVTSAAAKPSSATPSTAKAVVAAKTTAATVRVPNGVGLDYQSARDRWRAAGLHVAPAEDATGAHRLPIIDANWVVLKQDRKAGSKVPAGTFIRATVKKYSDD